MKLYRRMLKPVYTWRDGRDGMEHRSRNAENPEVWYDEDEKEKLKKQFAECKSWEWLEFEVKYVFMYDTKDIHCGN